MIDWIITTYSDNALIQFFFWGPVLFNGLIYPFHIWARYQRDRKTIKMAEEKPEGFYYASEFVTVGTLFKYLFLTVLPILNALATIFHAGPIAFEYLAERFSWLFSVKLAGELPKKGK